MITSREGSATMPSLQPSVQMATSSVETTPVLPSELQSATPPHPEVLLLTLFLVFTKSVDEE